MESLVPMETSAMPYVSHDLPYQIQGPQAPTQQITTRAMRGITKKKQIFDLAAFKTSQPSSFKQALKDPNWTQAMKTELDVLHKNKT